MIACAAGSGGRPRLKEDQSQWFTEAPQYADRTAKMMDALKGTIKLPFDGSHLRKRLKRVDDMAIYLDHERRRLSAIEASLIVEQAAPGGRGGTAEGQDREACNSLESLASGQEGQEGQEMSRPF